MENAAAKVIDIEEYAEPNEVVETSENSGMSTFLAGALGGFVAYGVISAATKLKAAIVSARIRKEAEAMRPSGTEVPEDDEAQPEDDASDE